jgi:hypothetical protein
MGLYNFKTQFIPYVLDGTKKHTIRASRKMMDRPGDVMHLYTGLRQKGARLLARRRCVRVEEITITESRDVIIDGITLTQDERNLLAWCDGFRIPTLKNPDDPRYSFDLMMRFWDGRLPFQGHVYHWSDEEVEGRVPTDSGATGECIAGGAIETRNTTRLILGDCYEEAVRPFREQLAERRCESGKSQAQCALELCLLLEAQGRDATLVICALVEEAGA